MQTNHLDNDRWMRPPEAARYSGRAESSLAKDRINGGGIPFARHGRNIVYRRSDIDAWLAARRVTSTSEAIEAA
jgi:predicted DNA-binding transcriptional regulator AlpA